ncbi:MAG: hypothetical protein GX601_00295, partial [Anaerolineales bacterium]|nr:hypothetical protein [Anaerolineales bacterium]
MSVSESTRKRFQVDWLISNLRWLLLISVGLVSLIDVTTQSGGAVDPDPLTPFTIIWAVAIIYNLVITLVLVAGAASPALPAATVAIDTALTIGFVATSGGLNSSLLFFALFPVLTANLRYPWWFSSLLALIIVVGCGLAGYRLDSAAVLTDGLRFGASALILLLAALVSGLLGDRLKIAVLQARRLEEEAELRQLRASHERARVVFELASTLSATLSSNAVLETILEVGEAGMQDLDRPGTSHVGIVLLSIREGLHIVAARHVSERDQRIVFSGSRGALAQALASAEPVLSDNPGADPELS